MENRAVGSDYGEAVRIAFRFLISCQLISFAVSVTHCLPGCFRITQVLLLPADFVFHVGVVYFGTEVHCAAGFNLITVESERTQCSGEHGLFIFNSFGLLRRRFRFGNFLDDLLSDRGVIGRFFFILNRSLFFGDYVVFLDFTILICCLICNSFFRGRFLSNDFLSHDFLDDRFFPGRLFDSGFIRNGLVGRRFGRYFVDGFDDLRRFAFNGLFRFIFRQSGEYDYTQHHDGQDQCKHLFHFGYLLDTLVAFSAVPSMERLLPFSPLSLVL